jgi:hypothetical protein
VVDETADVELGQMHAGELIRSSSSGRPPTDMLGKTWLERNEFLQSWTQAVAREAAKPTTVQTPAWAPPLVNA